MTLAGAPLHVQRATAGARVVAALVALVALFVPWHVVHPVGSALAGALCWHPDCHLHGGAVPTYGPAYTCTGWSHAHPMALVVLLALGALSLVRLRRPRIGVALVTSLVEIGALFAMFYATFDLKHMFDQVDPRIGQTAFTGALAAIAVTIATDVVAAPLLYLWARARLPHEQARATAPPSIGAGGARGIERTSPPRAATLLGHLTWLTVVVTCVALLGGLHPSNARRDAVIVVAASLVVALNTPIAVWSIRSFGASARRRAAVRSAILVAVRLAVATWVFVLVHGISHERARHVRETTARAARAT